MNSQSPPVVMVAGIASSGKSSLVCALVKALFGLGKDSLDALRLTELLKISDQESTRFPVRIHADPSADRMQIDAGEASMDLKPENIDAVMALARSAQSMRLRIPWEGEAFQIVDIPGDNANRQETARYLDEIKPDAVVVLDDFGFPRIDATLELVRRHFLPAFPPDVPPPVILVATRVDPQRVQATISADVIDAMREKAAKLGRPGLRIRLSSSVLAIHGRDELAGSVQGALLELARRIEDDQPAFAHELRSFVASGDGHAVSIACDIHDLVEMAPAYREVRRLHGELRRREAGEAALQAEGLRLFGRDRAAALRKAAADCRTPRPKAAPALPPWPGPDVVDLSNPKLDFTLYHYARRALGEGAEGAIALAARLKQALSAVQGNAARAIEAAGPYLRQLKDMEAVRAVSASSDDLARSRGLEKYHPAFPLAVAALRIDAGKTTEDAAYAKLLKDAALEDVFAAAAALHHENEAQHWLKSYWIIRSVRGETAQLKADLGKACHLIQENCDDSDAKPVPVDARSV